MEYFEKNLNMSFSGDFAFTFEKYSVSYSSRPRIRPRSITISIPSSDFNIQKFVTLGVKVQMVTKRQNGGTVTSYVEYRLTGFDASSSGGVTTLSIPYWRYGTGVPGNSPFVTCQTQVTFYAHFLRCSLPNGEYYNFDHLENTIVFTDSLPVTWQGGNEQITQQAFLGQTSDIRIWSVPEFAIPVYTSEIYANHKMVTLPIIANGQDILRLKCKQGMNNPADVISKYTPKSLLNRFVPVILTNGGLKSVVSSTFNEYEEGEIKVTTTVPDKITLGPLKEHGSENPYYYSGGNLYYKTVIFTGDLETWETVSVKYNFTSFDSSTRKVVFSLDTSSYTPTIDPQLLHAPGEVFTILTGLSFKLSSFYGQNTTSPESNMVILKTKKLYTDSLNYQPTSVTLDYNTPVSFQALMAWNGRSGARSKVY